MKKITGLIFSLLFLFFSLTLVIISVVRVSQGLEENKEVLGLNEEKEKKIEMEEEGRVNYILPYPGILPDHPLYWLKMVRDRVVLWLTKNPQKKIERLILYADKRINAAQILIGKGKAELGVTTITKAEKYLEQAYFQLEKTKERGNRLTALEEKFKKAALKHQEVLIVVLSRVPDHLKPVIENFLQKINQFYQ